MTKRCLGCGNVSDNNLYACATCLNTINEARRQTELKRFYKKDTMLSIAKITDIFSIIIVLAAISITFIILNRLKFPLIVQMIIFYPALIGFLIYFLVGEIVMKYYSKQSLKQFSNKDYYSEKPKDRLKDIRNIKPILLFIALSILAWLFFIIILVFLDMIQKVELPDAIFRLRNIIIFKVFMWSGLILGINASFNKYFDWIRGLEK
ncbi:MAG: hypothetical protein AB1629_01375 [Candidatus Omnitrophota bacterium]